MPGLARVCAKAQTLQRQTLQRQGLQERTFVLPPRPRHSAQTRELLPVPARQYLCVRCLLKWCTADKWRCKC